MIFKDTFKYFFKFCNCYFLDKTKIQRETPATCFTTTEVFPITCINLLHSIDKRIVLTLIYRWTIWYSGVMRPNDGTKVTRGRWPLIPLVCFLTWITSLFVALQKTWNCHCRLFTHCSILWIWKSTAWVLISNCFCNFALGFLLVINKGWSFWG